MMENRSWDSSADDGPDRFPGTIANRIPNEAVHF